jgi:hypothetical protein
LRTRKNDQNSFRKGNTRNTPAVKVSGSYKRKMKYLPPSSAVWY